MWHTMHTNWICSQGIKPSQQQAGHGSALAVVPALAWLQPSRADRRVLNLSVTLQALHNPAPTWRGAQEAARQTRLVCSPPGLLSTHSAL